MATTVIGGLNSGVSSGVLPVLDTVFRYALDVVGGSFSRCPRRQAGFFGLLRTVGGGYFRTLLHLPRLRFGLVISDVL